ncbi:MAG: polyprenyl synthetase family protein [Polyangiaceae bacterium]
MDRARSARSSPPQRRTPTTAGSPPTRNPKTQDALARDAFAKLLSTAKPAVEKEMLAMFAERRKQREGQGREVKSIIDTGESLSLRGGKRFRAALLFAGYYGVQPNGAIGVAVLGGVALEMLQSYLLIQDDWMDGDVERRGGPSAHVFLAKALGKGPLPAEHAGAVGALLTSDLVWGLAVDALLRAKVDAALAVRALAELVRIHEDVVAGQVLDTLAKKPDVEVLHDLKTGSYTVRGPLALGATLGGASNKILKSLAGYANPLGVAFQLRDDLLGVFGTEQEAGRPQGSDLLAGKSTAVVRHADARLRGAAKQAVARVWKNREASRADMAQAVDAIAQTGAREAVEKRLAELCETAESAARKLPLSEKARLELTGASLAIRVGPGGREAR